MDVPRLGWVAGAVALLATSLLGVSSAAGAATRTNSIELGGSNKHTIIFSGTTGEFGGAFVTAAPDALNAGKNIAYSAYSVSDATVTKRKFVAEFGKFGRVNADFKPTSDPKRIPVPDGCKGEPGSQTKGVFKGPIEFRGEGGYTSVDRNKARGVSRKNVEIDSCSGKRQTHQEVVLAAGKSSFPVPPPVVGFGARTRSASANPLFNANLFRDVGVVEITRLVNRVGSPGQFTYSGGYTTAHVDPPAPFSGTANFKETGSGGPDTGTFTGNLAVSFPGEKNVSLAGRGFEGSLRKAEFFKRAPGIFP